MKIINRNQNYIKPSWITFYSSFFFLIPIIYIKFISKKDNFGISVGCLLCFLSSILNHGYTNISNKLSFLEKDNLLIFLSWYDRIITQLCIVYFLYVTYNINNYWWICIIFVIIIGYIYYIKLDYIELFNNSNNNLNNPNIWHSGIHLISNIGIIILSYISHL